MVRIFCFQVASPIGWMTLDFLSGVHNFVQSQTYQIGKLFNGRSSGSDLLEVPTIYKAYVRPM